VRHTALPPPGDERQLKRLVGRIMSQQLDRGKPLWELWYIEGLSRDRFAVVTKLHHCMVDGIAGADLMAAMMGPVADAAVAAPPRWIPRPAPPAARLLADELLRRATLPLDIARGGRALLAQPGRSLTAARDALESIGAALFAGLAPASPTPINCDIGPHRRFDWLRLDLAGIKDIKTRQGGTINDVVLALVAGAMRRFLQGRGEQVDGIRFRAMVPVSVRATAERGHLGNRVSFLMTPLPIAERDATRRLQTVIDTTQTLKDSKQRRGGELLEEVSDRVSTGLFAQVARLGAQTPSYNMVVTNVPGPPFPVYLLDAQLREVYPLVPLFRNQALGIALFSYDGGLYWGFNADWDAVPDLHDLVGFVGAEYQALCATAPSAQTAQLVRPTARESRRRRRVSVRRTAARR
jgi:WS/DGAT/MGAT family acyltransferase